LNKKIKIPVQKFIKDINNDDWNVMGKYGMDHRQMVFVLGKLAERRRISFKKVVFFVKRYLDEGKLEKAEVCLKIIKKYFTGTWGIQTMVKGLEHDLASLKSRKAFQRKMDEKSNSLEWFKLEYTGTSLHPMVVSSVKILDHFTDKLHKKEKKDSTILNLPDVRSRLKIYLKYAHRFATLDPMQAIRGWHYISLQLFYQENIKHFIIRSIMDADTRDVCMHLDGTRLSVIKVLFKMSELTKTGKILPVNYFPAPMDVENLSIEQKAKVLMENGWYLPPFCKNCRCQIFPCSLVSTGHPI
jgi:hypothetical protein